MFRKCTQKRKFGRIFFKISIFLFLLGFSVSGGSGGDDCLSDGSGFDDSGLVFLGLGDLAVDVEDLLGVDLGAADDAGLVDLEVAEGDDGVAALEEGVGEDVVGEEGDDAVEGDGADALLDGLGNALADPGLELAGGVAVLGELALLAGGEGDDEDADDVAVLGLRVDDGLDHGAPLAEQGAELVGGDLHGVEAGEEVAAGELLDLELHLLEGLILGVVGVEVGEVGFVDTALHVVGDGADTDGLVADGLGELAVLEVLGSDDVEPFLLGHGFDDLLLVTALAALGDALVLADSHFVGGFFAKKVLGF